MDKQLTLYLGEVYSEPCQESKMKLFQSVLAFAKSCIFDVPPGSEYASLHYIVKTSKSNKENKIQDMN